VTGFVWRTVRRADGGLHPPRWSAVGVEVELHVMKAVFYDGIVHEQDPA
jgi:hypothetical protein